MINFHQRSSKSIWECEFGNANLGMRMRTRMRIWEKRDLMWVKWGKLGINKGKLGNVGKKDVLGVNEQLGDNEQKE